MKIFSSNCVNNQETNEMNYTGWLPPYPDMLDYTPETPEIKEMNTQLKLDINLNVLPNPVDLRRYFSPVENQGALGSCTAQAAVGVIEYFENRGFGTYLNGSRLFVYKTTRNLLGLAGDTGAWLRTTMAALALFGVPMEKYWPYTDRKNPGVNNDHYFDTEPTSFVYGIADNYEAVRYFCHDPLSKKISPENVLASVKRYLAYGIPSMFGFYGFPSFRYTDLKGNIPFPAKNEKPIWGHAVVAAGYDDKKIIKNPLYGNTSTGALLIRNSWGDRWGDAGYGWLPYDYVLKKYALDFWSLLSMRWVNTKNFRI